MRSAGPYRMEIDPRLCDKTKGAFLANNRNQLRAPTLRAVQWFLLTNRGWAGIPSLPLPQLPFAGPEQKCASRLAIDRCVSDYTMALWRKANSKGPIFKTRLFHFNTGKHWAYFLGDSPLFTDCVWQWRCFHCSPEGSTRLSLFPALSLSHTDADQLAMCSLHFLRLLIVVTPRCTHTTFTPFCW